MSSWSFAPSLFGDPWEPQTKSPFPTTLAQAIHSMSDKAWVDLAEACEAEDVEWADKHCTMDDPPEYDEPEPPSFSTDDLRDSDGLAAIMARAEWVNEADYSHDPIQIYLTLDCKEWVWVFSPELARKLEAQAAVAASQGKRERIIDGRTYKETTGTCSCCSAAAANRISDDTFVSNEYDLVIFQAGIVDNDGAYYARLCCVQNPDGMYEAGCLDTLADERNVREGTPPKLFLDVFNANDRQEKADRLTELMPGEENDGVQTEMEILTHKGEEDERTNPE